MNAPTLEQQGITVGCWGLCTVMTLTVNGSISRMSNPETTSSRSSSTPNFEVAESDFTNNAMKCNCKYDGHRIWIHNCHIGEHRSILYICNIGVTT
ncbi:unnamed protein product, partial [Staurois parvus]